MLVKNNETEDGIDELFRFDNKINSLKGVVPWKNSFHG